MPLCPIHPNFPWACTEIEKSAPNLPKIVCGNRMPQNLIIRVINNILFDFVERLWVPSHRAMVFDGGTDVQSAAVN